MKRNLLIDGDILVYRFAVRHQDITEWEPGQFSYTADLNAATEEYTGFIRGLKAELEADRVFVFLSDRGASFRRDLGIGYKAHRASENRPMLYGPLRDWLLKEKSAFLEPRLEGDDLLSLWATDPRRMERGEDIVCSIDKDMHTVPGRHYNWDKPDLGVQTIDVAQADRFFLTQVLTGDRVDGYPGCPGIGPVKAARLLTKASTSAQAWETVVQAYKTAKQTEQDAIANARCAWILRNGDFNDETKEIRMWTPERFVG